MTEKRTQAEIDHPGNAEKDPADWVTGDEPMTGAQKSYLQTLSEEAGVEFDETLTKADASKRIDELQQQTGRGLDSRERRHKHESGAEDDSEGGTEGSTRMSVGPS